MTFIILFSRVMNFVAINLREENSHLKSQFPHVAYLSASIDDHLSPDKFISPGIGDFGARFFGTD